MSLPTVLEGKTYRCRTGCGNVYVTINEDEGEPKQCFIRLGKAGGCASANMDVLGRMIGRLLRAGVPLADIASDLKGTRCNSPYGFGENEILSCADAVGTVLNAYLEEKEKCNSS